MRSRWAALPVESAPEGSGRARHSPCSARTPATRQSGFLCPCRPQRAWDRHPGAYADRPPGWRSRRRPKVSWCSFLTRAIDLVERAAVGKVLLLCGAPALEVAVNGHQFDGGEHVGVLFGDGLVGGTIVIA